MSSTAKRSAAVFALFAGVLGCTTTVVDPSARSRDPAVVWEEQIAQATRSHSQGRWKSASASYDAALATSEAFPPGDLRRLQTLNQRAELYLSQRLYEAAERDFLEVIAEERSSSREDGEQLANALNNLAVFYLDLGRIPEAEPLLAEAIDLRVAIYGSDHPYVATLLQNLGEAERRVGNLPVAEDLLIRSLTIYSRAGRDYWRNASVAQNNLALLQAEDGRVQDAERNHLLAIRLSIKTIGERNTDIGVFIRDLATLYTHQRRFDEAENLYLESISILREGLGEASHQLSKTYRAYSKMLGAVGRREEAAEYRRRADATGF